MKVAYLYVSMIAAGMAVFTGCQRPSAGRQPYASSSTMQQPSAIPQQSVPSSQGGAYSSSPQSMPSSQGDVYSSSPGSQSGAYSSSPQPVPGSQGDAYPSSPQSMPSREGSGYSPSPQPQGMPQ